MSDPRQLAGAGLAQALTESRARTLAWTLDLSDPQWLPPQRDGVNPVAWELAHLAWFAEFFALRGPHHHGADGRLNGAEPARHAGPDALFDSGRLPHADRWQAPLPSRQGVLRMMAAQLDDALTRLAALPEDADDAALYLYRLVLFHEDMHAEAFAWLRSTLGYPAPAGLAPPGPVRGGRVDMAGGAIRLGRSPDRDGFAFDNELPGEAVTLEAFDIDRSPVSAGEFLRFVEAGGYEDAAFWPGAAGDWLAQSGRRRPLDWRDAANGWEVRWFDRWQPLDPDRPVIHVNAWEAEAFCRWAGRRLPSAAQWEFAATGADDRLDWGTSVWEWTADAFRPYPGFRAGPYADYSAPWFESHRELRGSAFATPSRLRDPRFRNFFLPERADIFAGFRTVSAP